MKHTKMIFAVLLMTAMVLPAVAQVKKGVVFKNPDEATYAIIADTMKSSVKNGKPLYELINPQGKQSPAGYIKFDTDMHFIGKPAEGEQVFFSLQNAETDRPNKFNDEMLFWSWNEMADEWQLDIESGSGRNEYEQTTFINIMLVLDCSGSMGDAFASMKKEARYVLKRLYDVSRGRGNVRVGIIGFSTIEYSKTHTLDPIELTYSNLMKLNNYIGKLKPGGGTALYYSVNEAVEHLRKDFEQNIKGKDFAGSAIIAFTDGHDNTSNDVSKGYTNSKDYFNYTLNWFPNNKIGENGKEKPIMSFCVGMRGNDIISDNIWEVTQDQFRAVFGNDNFFPIYKITELHEKFDYIVSRLIDSHTFLNLYVANGIFGRVGWTYPEEKEKAPKQPKQPGKFWLGICAEGGTASEEYKKYRPNGFMYESGSKSYFFYGLGIDATLPLASWFGLGASFSLTMNTKKEDKGKISGYGVGPLMKFTFNNASALLMGAGIKKVVSGTNPYVMLGWKFRSPWYVKGFVTINDDSIWDAGLGVGISLFGGRNKKVQPADAIENEE